LIKSRYEDVRNTQHNLEILFDALLLATKAIDKIMLGGEDITQDDLVISKLLGQDIMKYRSLFPHVSAAIHAESISILIHFRSQIFRFLLLFPASNPNIPSNTYYCCRYSYDSRYDPEICQIMYPNSF
jgi:hypothetical protein